MKRKTGTDHFKGASTSNLYMCSLSTRIDIEGMPKLCNLFVRNVLCIWRKGPALECTTSQSKLNWKLKIDCQR
jgi:hypothetical protein